MKNNCDECKSDELSVNPPDTEQQAGVELIDEGITATRAVTPKRKLSIQQKLAGKLKKVKAVLSRKSSTESAGTVSPVAGSSNYRARRKSSDSYVLISDSDDEKTVSIVN